MRKHTHTDFELIYPIPTTNIVKKLQRVTISGLVIEEVPSFAPLTVNSPLAKRNRNPLQTYSKGPEVGRSLQSDESSLEQATS